MGAEFVYLAISSTEILMSTSSSVWIPLNQQHILQIPATRVIGSRVLHTSAARNASIASCPADFSLTVAIVVSAGGFSLKVVPTTIAEFWNKPGYSWKVSNTPRKAGVIMIGLTVGEQRSFLFSMAKAHLIHMLNNRLDF